MRKTCARTPADLAAFRGVDTLVFLMASSRLGLLCQRLQQEGGRAATTPVCVVKWAGHAEKQRIWRGALSSIERLTAGF